MNRGAIILCGGRSSRMGRDKAMLPFGDGGTLLEHVVWAVADVVPLDCIVCVAAREQSLPPLPPGVKVVFDSQPFEGPLAGLCVGLAAIGDHSDAVFVTGCDTPLLTTRVVSRMFESLCDSEIVAPHDGAHWYPLTAVYRTEVLRRAEALLSGGERRLSALLDYADAKRVSLVELREVDPELGFLCSCNTLAEYEMALARSAYSIGNSERGRVGE